MRSEEGAGGPGAALSARGPSWREKLSAPEAQFRRESPRRESALAPAPSFSESGAGKPREEKRTALSKVGVGPHNPPWGDWACALEAWGGGSGILARRRLEAQRGGAGASALPW